MRTVSETLRAAVQDSNSAHMSVKAVVDPSRVFFNTPTANNPYETGIDFAVPTDEPRGQCMCYSPTLDKAITFIVDGSSGTIYGMAQGSDTKHNLGVSAYIGTKPGVFHRDNGTVYLWWCNQSGSLRRAVVNVSSWALSANTAITVDYIPEDWTITAGSPIVLDEDQIVYVYFTSIGGLGVAYYNGSRFYHWERRFISPNALTTVYWTTYTGACNLDNRIFVYSTDIDTGEVRGVRYQPYKHRWSDSFTALPADLSRFDVGNVVMANGYIHMAGQFHRTEDLKDAKVYSLVVRSIDGFTFSWDRFTLLSTLGYQFQIGLDDGAKKVYASDRNVVGAANMSYYFTPVPPDRLEIQESNDIVSLAVNDPTTATMRLRGYDEYFIDHATIHKGNRLTLYLGFMTAVEVVSSGTNYEWVEYQKYIIDSVETGFGDGARTLVLGLKDEGSWKTSQLAFPFYAELISKATQYDDCDEIDHMYPVETCDKEMFTFLYLDFWNNDEWDGDGEITGTPTKWRTEGGPGCNYRDDLTNGAGEADQLLMKTCDLNEQPFINEYPVIGNTTVTARFYGWERTDRSTKTNSNWYMYAVTAPADDLDTKSVTVGILHDSMGGVRKFPQKDPDDESGKYPIIFTWDTLTNEHVLLYFGFACRNSSVGTSTINLERIEVEGVSFSYSQLSSSSTWEVNNPDPETYDRKYLRMPATGLPAIQFVTKPYSAFRFTMAADFIYEPGDEPLTIGKVGWGVVGIARDGNNYILARWLKNGARLQVVLVRNGVETLLAEEDLAQPDGVMMDHRDGLIRVWYRATGSTVWQGPYLEYSYDEITHGVISMSETDIMHMGIYAAVNPPGFLCASFNPGDAEGVCMIASSDDSILDGFPDTGKVAINKIQYTYTSRTPRTGDYLGPYQGRQTWNYKAHDDTSNFGGGWGHENAAYFPESIPTRMTGLLLGADNGHTWLIDRGSDWTVYHFTRGNPVWLPHRSRHYCAKANGNYIGVDNRTHIGPGLLGMSRVGSGNLVIHPYGALVSLYGSDQIWAKSVVSTQVDRDATVKDMLKELCYAACVNTEFTGDWTDDTRSVGTSPVTIAGTAYLFPGGYDVYFTIPQLSDGHDVTLYANNVFIMGPDPEDPEEDPEPTAYIVKISIKRQGNTLRVISTPTGGTRIEEVTVVTDVLQAGTHDIRILFHSSFCTVYIDKTSTATFAYGEDDLKWPDTGVGLRMTATATYDITNITVCELFDWREAIYVESELTAASALGSVVQERPIEMAPTSSGGLAFSYNIERDTITYTNAQTLNTFRRHKRADRTVGDAGSDAIVYYEDVDFVTYQPFADEEGFLTRVLKLSTLETGAQAAAQILLEKAYERQFPHTIEMRPDPRIEIGDRVEFHYIVPGTATQKDYAIIVETLQIGVEEGLYGMIVTGREDELT